MPAPNWPAGLPQLMLLASYSEQALYNALRTEMDIGPAKSRRRSTAGVRMAQGAFIMTQAQYATFQTFMSGTIADGARAFYLPNQATGIGTVLCRLVEPPTLQRRGSSWSVNMTIEILP